MQGRAAWGARAATGGYASWKHGHPLGTVGHWEGPTMGTWPHELCPTKVRGIQNYHQNNGYIDIAYNEADCPHGERYEGRPANVASAANGPQANGTHYAYCGLRGIGDPFPAAMQGAMSAAIAQVGGERLAHRDVNATSCPGPEQYAFIHGTAGAPPAPAAPAAPAPVLVRRGSTGNVVRALQEMLTTIGFQPGPIDGDFGPRTEAAVRAFQTAAGIQVDGIAGPETFAHAYAAVITRRPGTPTAAGVKNPTAAAAGFVGAAPSTVLRRGSRGAYVVLLQSALNKKAAAGLVPDGVFGPKTEAAVRAFQRARGLTVDGIVGPQTWGALR